MTVQGAGGKVCQGGGVELKLRCVMRKEKNGFAAECLELNLYAEGETRQQCKDRLEEAIEAFFRTIADAPEGARIVRRPVPFYRLRKILWEIGFALSQRRMPPHARRIGPSMFPITKTVPGTLIGLG